MFHQLGIEELLDLPELAIRPDENPYLQPRRRDTWESQYRAAVAIGDLATVQRIAAKVRNRARPVEIRALEFLEAQGERLDTLDQLRRGMDRLRARMDDLHCRLTDVEQGLMQVPYGVYADAIEAGEAAFDAWETFYQAARAHEREVLGID